MTVTSDTKTAADSQGVAFSLSVANEGAEGIGPWAPYHYLRSPVDGSFVDPMPKEGGSVVVIQAALPQGAAQDGVDGENITPPVGGTGIRGWLSGIYASLAQIIEALAGPLSVTSPPFAFGGHSLNAAVSITPAVGGSIATNQIPVLATPTSVLPANTGNVRRLISVRADSTAPAFIGPSSVTITSGFMLMPGQQLDLSNFTGALFAIAAAAGTTTVASLVN
jgi:hypothetical protein